MGSVIKKISDNVFDDETFTRIAENLKMQNKKLFSVVNSEIKAKDVQHDLNVNGYQSTYEKCGNVFNVYYSPEAPKFRVDEEILKQFKNLGDEKYCAFGKTSIAGLYDYNFDDGAIWTLQTCDDGQQYLVKEITDDDENNVVRKKQASVNKQKQKLPNIIKSENVLDELNNKIIASLKDNKLIVTDALVNEIRNKVILSSLSVSLPKIINDIVNETDIKGANSQCQKK